MKDPSGLLVGAGFLFFAGVAAWVMWDAHNFAVHAHRAQAHVLQSMQASGGFEAVVRLLPPDEEWGQRKLTSVGTPPAVGSTIEVLVNPTDSELPVRAAGDHRWGMIGVLVGCLAASAFGFWMTTRDPWSVRLARLMRPQHDLGESRRNR